MHRIGIGIMIAGAFCWLLATAQQVERVFIPHTPSTEQELDDPGAGSINEHGGSESAAEEVLSGADTERYRFTEDDFRRAFPSLSPDDEQVSICGNSMMSGATRLVYLSPAAENTVTVKVSGCRPVEGGLSCSPLSESVNYFFESPEHNFTLDDGVSFAEAQELLTAFRDHGIAALPDWYMRQRFGYLDVANIGKAGDVYALRLGEFFCRGCTATFKVRIEGPNGDQRRLILVEEPEGMCI